MKIESFAETHVSASNAGEMLGAEIKVPCTNKIQTQMCNPSIGSPILYTYHVFIHISLLEERLFNHSNASNQFYASSSQRCFSIYQ
jgi:hypothetical protein